MPVHTRQSSQDGEENNSPPMAQSQSSSSSSTDSVAGGVLETPTIPQRDLVQTPGTVEEIRHFTSSLSHQAPMDLVEEDEEEEEREVSNSDFYSLRSAMHSLAETKNEKIFKEFTQYLKSLNENKLDNKLSEEDLWSASRFRRGERGHPHTCSYGTDEERVVIKINIPPSDKMFPKEVGLPELGILLDFLAVQYDFFKERDCCNDKDILEGAEEALIKGALRIRESAERLSQSGPFEVFYEHCVSNLLIPPYLKSIFLPNNPERIAPQGSGTPQGSGGAPQGTQALHESTPVASNPSTTSNFLLAMPKVPNWTNFVPTKDPIGNYNRTLEYAISCQSLPCNLRIASWPDALKTSINTQYKIHRVCQKQAVDRKEDVEAWQDFNASEMVTFLQTIFQDQGRGAACASASPYSRFTAYLSRNKILIDFNDRQMPSSHPFTIHMNAVKREWSEIHGPDSGITQENEKEIISKIKDDILLKGLSAHEGIAWFQTTLEEQWKGVKSVEKALERLETFVFKALIDLLQQQKRFERSHTTLRVSGQPSERLRGDYENCSKQRFPQGTNNGWGLMGSWRDTSLSSENDRQGHKRPSNFKSSSAAPAPKRSSTTPIGEQRCKRCGWNRGKDDHGGRKACQRPNCSEDPRRNMENKEWQSSTTGIQWKRLGLDFLPKDSSITLRNYVPKGTESKTYSYTAMIAHCNDLLLTQELIGFSFYGQGRNKRERSSKKQEPLIAGHLLLDTGAVGSCVVSTTFYNDVMVKNHIELIKRNISHSLNTPLTAQSNLISNIEISFIIYLTGEDAKSSIIPVRITAIVAPINVALIVDRDTIKNNNLLFYFPSHFAEGELITKLSEVARGLPPAVTQQPIREESIPQRVSSHHSLYSLSAIHANAWANKLQRKAEKRRAAFFKIQKDLRATHRLERDQTYRSTVSPIYLATLETDPLLEDPDDYLHRSYLATMSSNISRKAPFERDGSLTDIPDNKLESIPADILNENHNNNDYTKVIVEGPPHLQNKLRELINEFSTIFKASVQGQPAKLKPFKLQVDHSKWHTPANRLRPRSVSREQATEIKKLLQILLDNHIIEISDDSYYSHAFLVPKPNGKWRMVLDFKNLNSATTNYYHWPIPNIRDMLQRVGESRPRFFAVFDLTSGYYQAPIDVESRNYTAFLTQEGLYRWLRLPMGLTGAGSYFQHSLTTQVLTGLIQSGVELYLDDCMVHANTWEQFLERLRTVFLRFRDSGVTLNPSKCILGLSQVEYVGHTISKDGLHFTRDKLDSVLNFPRPQTKRQVKSFLGLANYFRDHIKNHSNRVQALQSLVDGYDKRQARHKIQWTKDQILAFEDIRQAIDNCPLLWFVNDFSDIYLQTDASGYGIGAYLYQVVLQDNGTTVEQPIGFISKSIANAHASWDTSMKEGYAIFYALKKWEYLLRDRQFTIRTDHQNLTRLRRDHDTNKMVKRWFMAYQEFDIKAWEFVKGTDNLVPDEFSRLCEDITEDNPSVSLFQLTGYKVSEKHWTTIASVHNFEQGHGGVERILRMLDNENIFWDGRTKDVRNFIKLCPCCQKMDQIKRVVHSYPFTTSTYGLWHTVSIDYIEQIKPDEAGNNMIIVIVDNFSRFVDLHATNSTNAEGAADALLAFVGRYASPLHITTDSGANFKSGLFRSLAERLGADHYLTKAYSKESNGLVERQNKEVMRHLRNIVFDKRISVKWSKYLPIVQRIINAAVNSATGLSPSEIVFPNGMQLDHSLLSESGNIFYSSYIKDMQEAQSRVIAIAEHELREKDKAHIENYSSERTSFDVGSYVLAEHRHNSLRRGPKSKMLPFLKGPLLVTSKDNTGNYVLKDIVTNRVADYHVSKLRPFLYDERTLQPIQVAVTDHLDEFIAEECLQMKGNIRGSRKNLQFKIRWAGYGPEDDTWEPWDYCRDSAAVRTFLVNHQDSRVRRLAPKDYIPEVNTEQEEESSDSDMSIDEP